MAIKVLIAIMLVCPTGYTQGINWSEILKTAASAPQAKPQALPPGVDPGKFVDQLTARMNREALAVPDFVNVPVVVADVPKNNFNLEKYRVQARVELKLRSAHLKPHDPSFRTDALLRVAVSTVGAAFQIKVEFYRKAGWVLPDGTAVDSIVISYDDGTFGTHGGSAIYILDSLDAIMETFTNKYLEANQD